MTDQPETGEAPVPDAAPAPDPVASAPDLHARIRGAEAELARLRSEAAALPHTVLLRIKGGPGKPSAMIRGGYTIGTDPVPVPQSAVPMLSDAAAEAGITLEEA